MIDKVKELLGKDKLSIARKNVANAQTQTDDAKHKFKWIEHLFCFSSKGATLLEKQDDKLFLNSRSDVKTLERETKTNILNVLETTEENKKTTDVGELSLLTSLFTENGIKGLYPSLDKVMELVKNQVRSGSIFEIALDKVLSGTEYLVPTIGFIPTVELSKDFIEKLEKKRKDIREELSNMKAYDKKDELRSQLQILNNLLINDQDKDEIKYFKKLTFNNIDVIYLFDILYKLGYYPLLSILDSKQDNEDSSKNYIDINTKIQVSVVNILESSDSFKQEIIKILRNEPVMKKLLKYRYEGRKNILRNIKKIEKQEHRKREEELKRSKK